MSDIYPEHAKASPSHDEREAIEEFIHDNPYQLCEWVESEERYVPVSKSVQQVVAEHYGIDLTKIEEERRQMLDRLRSANGSES